MDRGAMISVANSYLRSGLCVLPAIAAEKRPALRTWKQYQARLPTEEELERWFVEAPALCLLTGAVSGNLELLDFDLGGEAFEPWHRTIEQADSALLGRLVIEQSPSGGWHVVYRCQSPVSGSLKLAQRKQMVDGPEEVMIAGKGYKPRKDADGNWHVLLTLIETRGEGGLFLCAPSPRYELMQGDFTQLPVLTEAEREMLLAAAWALNQCVPEPVEPPPASVSAEGRPGDEFNERGDVRAVLRRHGWTLVQAGDNEYWRRPGKTSGWSATLKNGVFYVFSSSAAPFEPDRAYAPFAVYSLLEHNSDYAAAASALRQAGFGHEPLTGGLPMLFTTAEPTDDEPEPPPAGPDDPGLIPDELFHVPGFVNEVINFCMQISPHPSLGMAFCGALALQSFLCGRKIRDPGDLRTNIHLLALAGASTGKDHPRRINAHVLFQIGCIDCLGDKFASGEGIQDAMNQNHSMLFQNDEIDSMLHAVNKSREGYHESIMSTLLEMYTSSASVFPMRRKAGKQPPGVIDQPHLTLFGTATPKYYYEALSERMLTNGFFARMIIVDVGKRSEGKEAGLVDQMPQRILDTAQWWSSFVPGEKRRNLIEYHPLPAIVPYDPAAEQLLGEFRRHADHQYALAEERGDEVSKTVWGRANENARKLALLYACSTNHENPLVDANAAQWSMRLADHQVRRMLFMAYQYVAKNQFDAMCKELLRHLRQWHEKKGSDAWMPEWELNRRLSWRPRDHDDVRNALLAQRRIEHQIIPGKKPKPVYRLR